MPNITSTKSTHKVEEHLKQIAKNTRNEEGLLTLLLNELRRLRLGDTSAGDLDVL